MKTGGRGFGSAPFFAASICGGCHKNWTQDMVPASGALAPRFAAALAPPSAGAYFLGGAGSLTRPPAARGACMVGVGRAGTRPRLRRHCPALAALRSGLKRCAALPCRFAAAARSRLRACGRFAGGRPLRRGAAAPAGSPAALRLLAAPAARLLRFAPAAVAARSAARPALASRPLRGSPLCPCACWAALSLSPVAPVLRLRASPARVAAARPARPPRRALSRLSLPPGGCAALGLSPSLAALCGVPPPGVGLFCGWRGGAPAGAGLGVPLAAASGDAAERRI